MQFEILSAAKELGISSLNQFMVLLLCDGTMNLTTMARKLNLSPPSVTLISEVLVKENLVTRKQYEDRRITILEWTEKGTEFIASVS
jgi:DNA-binding MarR family transcriptional regulator